MKRQGMKKKGAINKRIDQDLVKSVAVYYALEKVFQNYDVDRATEKGIKGFIITTFHSPNNINRIGINKRCTMCR